MAIKLLTTDRNLTVVGDPIVCWSKVTSVLRFNVASSGQFDAPAYPWLLDQLETGSRIVLIRDRTVWCAGPLIEYKYSKAVQGQASHYGTITVTFADDFAPVGGRVTYPNPAVAADDITQPARYNLAATNAETAIRNLINLNAGPGALTARQIPQLVLGTVAGVGSNISVSTRFEPLMDAVRSAAIAGGGLGVRTRQVGDQIVVEVYQPVDRTGSVRFSFGLRNLVSADYTRTAPTLTAAIVGGQGEGADRTITEYLDTAGVTAWGRLEQWVDQRNTNDATELDQSGTEALAEGGEKAQLATVTVDTDTQRYGEHYGLGDRVSIEVWPGREVADVVRSVQLDAESSTGAETVTATVGSQEASSDPNWVRQLRRIDRKLSYLQANAEVPV